MCHSFVQNVFWCQHRQLKLVICLDQHTVIQRMRVSGNLGGRHNWYLSNPFLRKSAWCNQWLLQDSGRWRQKNPEAVTVLTRGDLMKWRRDFSFAHRSDGKRELQALLSASTMDLSCLQEDPLGWRPLPVCCCWSSKLSFLAVFPYCLCSEGTIFSGVLNLLLSHGLNIELIAGNVGPEPFNRPELRALFLPACPVAVWSVTLDLFHILDSTEALQNQSLCSNEKTHKAQYFKHVLKKTTTNNKE